MHCKQQCCIHLHAAYAPQVHSPSSPPSSLPFLSLLLLLLLLFTLLLLRAFIRGEFSTLLLTLLKLASLAVWLLIRLDDLIQCRAQPVVLVVIMAEWVVAQDLRCESLRDVLLMRPAPENTVSMLALAARPASLGRPTPLYVTKEGNRVLIFHIARNATDRKKRWRCGKGRRNRQISTGAYSQDHIHTQPSQHSSIECH